MFSSFEWGVAFRYLKARRSDRFISVIAGFSLIGICLGVMVLIVVMAVMNGFRHELLDRVLGLNGHAIIVGYNGELLDYDALTEEIRAVPGVIRRQPDGRGPGDGDLSGPGFRLGFARGFPGNAGNSPVCCPQYH